MKIEPLVAQQLKSGGIGVLPTDTLYGLVGQALNQAAVERIYKVKGRAPEKPCIILISNIADLALFGVNINEWIPGQARDVANTRRLINQLWPGPVSIVLPCVAPPAGGEFEYLHRGTKSLAFRLPADAELRELLAQTGPLIAPSANPEGKEPAKTIEEAKAYFGDRADFYVDAGELHSEPSTLIAITEGKVRILRQGSVTIPTELL